MLQTVATVCGILIGSLLLYYVTHKERPQANSSGYPRGRYVRPFRNLLQENCPICLSSLEDSEKLTLKCGHFLHTSCYQDCINEGLNQCPLCRERF